MINFQCCVVCKRHVKPNNNIDNVEILIISDSIKSFNNYVIIID